MHVFSLRSIAKMHVFVLWSIAKMHIFMVWSIAKMHISTLKNVSKSLLQGHLKGLSSQKNDVSHDEMLELKPIYLLPQFLKELDE
jgi:hypothetical protein